ncbi:BrnT family toxin [Desulfonema magnum]|uniref:Toxin-antitoxin system, toxin component, type II BrnT n=1 Tax=Desulfonema magnum TaxID=45655 RepID=A0A975BSB4_9BACT|nr:BrnT family toxin [Desulfonema magnum]QTA90817.1 Putative toxin-antitoxin system, toxin component, type II BrnT [Desulfonema magnum]
MDIWHTLNGFDFVWDEKKARKNLISHNISFEEACEVFFDPFYKLEDASRHGEERRGLIGYSESGRMLYVVSVEKGDEAWRIVSARKAVKKERRQYEEENDFV